MTDPERAAQWSIATGYIGISPGAYETEALQEYARVPARRWWRATSWNTRWPNSRPTRAPGARGAEQRHPVGADRRRQNPAEALEQARSPSPPRLLEPYGEAPAGGGPAAPATPWDQAR
jgi:sn-glycerol 3-phosphate transport system substrate-binding protein